MIPLSCVNCCHNPLQLGPLGTAFGYCTRHRVILNRPEVTTCGQLFRKDLLADSSVRQRALHAQTYARDRVALVADSREAASKHGFIEEPNGNLPEDAVVEEVQNYGSLDSNIGTMAALRRVPGIRAEVAMLSLSRAYFNNCVSRGGQWTAGVHLLFWTLRRLDQAPEIAASDLRGPIAFSVTKTASIARWTLLAFRLAFTSDVGAAAASTGDPVGRLSKLANQAVLASPGCDADSMLKWLSSRRTRWSSALTKRRYEAFRKELHQGEIGVSTSE